MAKRQGQTRGEAMAKNCPQAVRILAIAGASQEIWEKMVKVIDNCPPIRKPQPPALKKNKECKENERYE